MNTAADILSYAQIHNINMVAEGGQLKIDAPEIALTDEFLKSAKAHKTEIMTALSQERWNQEMAAQGYTWCFDCRNWNGQCTSKGNPFAKVEKCPQAARICKWYLDKGADNAVN